MKRILVLSILIFAISAAALGGQSGSGTSTTKERSRGAPATMSLIGCVGTGDAAGKAFTLSNDDGTIAYRLSGVNMRRYVGHRVTVFGTSDSARVKIVGGLTPSLTYDSRDTIFTPSRGTIAIWTGRNVALRATRTAFNPKIRWYVV